MTDIYNKLSTERKKLQKAGEIPPWYTTAAYQMFKEKYQHEGATVKQTFRRIADTAAGHLRQHNQNVGEWSDKFFTLLWNGWLSPSTPVLSNMGTDKGMAVSCSGGYVGDSINDFYKSYHEVAMLTKFGFGTSSYIGDIRPRGSKISRGGKAAGTKPVFEHFIHDMRVVTQGNSRRGAFAAYIDIEHGDFDELADLVLHEPDDANIGWNITDKFIKKLNEGNSEALRRYQKALKLKMVTGKGYFFFVDKVNRKLPKWCKDHNLTVKASNLCLRGDTIITIKDTGAEELIRLDNFIEKYALGMFVAPTVKTYKDGEVIFSKVTNAAITGTAEELIRIETTTGKIIECTENHLIFTRNRGWVAANNLSKTDILIESSLIPSMPLSITRIKIEEESVYDITVPETQSFFANNILVHNCNEITLFSDENHTFTCVLSSMNLFRYDEWKDTDAVFNATVFLDCVAEDLIINGSNIPGLENAIRFTKKGRALGLGTCGFHSYIQSKNWSFEGLEAHLWNIEAFKKLDDDSKKASEWMAKEFGEPEWCKGYGVRNTHRIAIPPTKSNALLQGGVSEGINPDPALVFTQATAAGEVDRITPVFLEFLKSKKKHTKEVIDDIIEHNGSIQHVDWMTDDEKLVYRTAFEIDQKAVLRLAATRAKYLDQWQSLNLFFSSEEDEKYISEVHQEAFMDERILGLYYVYSLTGVKAAKNECIACQ